MLESLFFRHQGRHCPTSAEQIGQDIVKLSAALRIRLQDNGTDPRLKQISYSGSRRLFSQNTCRY